ncbi:hypothetical protein DFH08DRAFT_797545 [Mycena albidolilacea]|uniref:Transmembrane protein n=1 Tax=Mycena albidolilacea TaxID=1033008 RepID=A0AAD7F5F4_9AGAR|nr:hypothetical protein DFH08DRAFT_797545 [Mycena albidolilacea]
MKAHLSLRIVCALAVLHLGTLGRCLGFGPEALNGFAVVVVVELILRVVVQTYRQETVIDVALAFLKVDGGALLRSLAHLLLAMIHCVPPYYPSPGHETRSCHDNDSMCLYYAVFVGRTLVLRTLSWIARDQTDRFTDAQHKGFKKWAELEQWWRVQCSAHHPGACPEFEAVNFTLDPPSNTHPSTPACNRAPAAPVDSCTAMFAPVRAAEDPTIRVRPMAAGSPFAASPQPKREEGEASLKREDTEPSLHLNVPPRVHALTRVQLTPTGHARGTALVAARTTHQASPPPPASVRPSVLVTPAPANFAAERGPRYYGIRGVSVFYHTHAAAATSLQLTEPHIMVSRNVEKLERWMFGEPFEGEDAEA